jgi:hypothetical protein
MEKYSTNKLKTNTDLKRTGQKEEKFECRKSNTDGAVPKKKKTIINERNMRRGQHKKTEEEEKQSKNIKQLQHEET